MDGNVGLEDPGRRNVDVLRSHALDIEVRLSEVVRGSLKYRETI